MRFVSYMMFTLIAAGCVQKPETMSGPTIGSLDIIADESIRYIIEQEEEVFEETYKHADLDITYLPEFDMYREFMSDSVRMIVTTRTLTEEELEYFDQRQSHPVTTSFATGALAFITNSTGTDTAFTYEGIMEMMRNPGTGKLFVVENARSGISREVMSLLDTTALPSHFYAFQSKQEVVDYLRGHDNAIGIVDWSEISDSDNPNAKAMLSEVNLLAISRPLDSVQHGFVKPYQYNLQDNKYPFTRELYIISRTGKNDVGSGFASFVAGEIGQKIILKSGLLPKFQSERILEIRTTSDIEVVE